MKNEFERRPYISAVLIFLAFAFLSIFWLIMIAVGIVYYWSRDRLTEYIYNVGVSVDYLLATLIFSTKAHTISAIVHKRGYVKTVAFVNWLFRDSDHCQSSYRKEYLKDG
jgi:hypothetical protein